MKEHPILFSPEMVAAILDGRKTQTRRVTKPQPVGGDSICLSGNNSDAWLIGRMRDSENAWRVIRCQYGQPGDRLWVKERHCFLDVTKSALSKFPLGPQNKNERGPDVWNVCVEYSDGSELPRRCYDVRPKQTRERGEIGWRPSILMPRWASRLVLEVTAVRVERVQDISNADAQAEGVHGVDWGHGMDYSGDANYTPVYHELWDSLNAGRGFGWATNPWVWVLSFKKR